MADVPSIEETLAPHVGEVHCDECWVIDNIEDYRAHLAAVLSAREQRVVAAAHRGCDESDADLNIVRRVVNAWNCCGTCAGGVLARHVRAAKAEAWDEGYLWCSDDFEGHALSCNHDYPCNCPEDPLTANPYRANAESEDQA